MKPSKSVEIIFLCSNLSTTDIALILVNVLPQHTLTYTQRTKSRIRDRAPALQVEDSVPEILMQNPGTFHLKPWRATALDTEQNGADQTRIKKPTV